MVWSNGNISYFEEEDFRNFRKDHFLSSDKNRKALLFFKDENPHDYIKELIGLRSKLYAIKTVNHESNIKCKAYIRNIRDTYLSFENYKLCHDSLNIYIGFHFYPYEDLTINYTLCFKIK